MADGGKAKILVVDDEPGIVQVIRQWLEQHQYEVITASSGQEGLGKAHSERPDLVLLDVMMPGIDGYTASLQLAHEHPTRVIICSAIDQKHLGELFQGKVDGWVRKPFSLEALLQEVERVLKIRDA